MKKLIAIILLALMTIGAYSQTAVTKGTSVARWGTYLYVPTTATKFGTCAPVQPGTLIVCGGDTNYSYVTKGYTWGQGGTLALILANSQYYVRNLKVGTGSFATLAVSSTSALTGNVTMAGALSVTGAATLGSIAAGTTAVGPLSATTGTFSGTLNATGAFTAAVLPTFTIAAAITSAIPHGDTIHTVVAGLTSSAVIFAQYVAPVAADDTLLTVKTVAAGWFTVQGKAGRTVKYWIPKK